MELHVIKKPIEHTFSGNPIDFLLQLTPYNASSNVGFTLQATVEVDRSYKSGAYEAVHTATYFFNENGAVKFDISSILDAHLEFFLPSYINRRIYPASGQFKNWRLRLSVTDGKNVVINPFYVPGNFVTYKGGLSYSAVQERFIDNMRLKKFFLGRNNMQYRVFTDEVFFYYLINFDFDELNDANLAFRLYRYIKGSDGIEYRHTVVDQNFFLNLRNELMIIPAGISMQNSLSVLPAGVLPVTIEDVMYWAAPSDDFEDFVELGRCKLLVEHRNFYNTHQLYWCDSQGNFETIRLRGQAEYEADYIRQNATAATVPNYFINGNPKAQTVSYNPSERQKTKADTGFITREELERLRGLLLSKQVYEYKNEKFIPININNNNVKLYTNKDFLYNLQLEYQEAFESSYHTPPVVLDEGYTCPAMKEAKVTVINKNTVLVAWSMVENYDEVDIFLRPEDFSTGIGFRFKGTSGVEKINIPDQYIIDEDYDGFAHTAFIFKTVCDAVGGGYGPETTVVVDLPIGGVDPVAVDDNYSIPAGLVQPLTLAPSCLANDYHPDGDAIEAVAVTDDATEQGGTISINAAGAVTYLPPSPGFAGGDRYEYGMRKVGGSTVINANINLFVAVPSGGGVFARLVLRNVATIEVNTTTVYGEAWIEYYANPQGTQVLDVTGLGISINYRRKRERFSPPEVTNTDVTTNATNFEQIIFQGILSQTFNTGGGRGSDFALTFELRPGNGYTII